MKLSCNAGISIGDFPRGDGKSPSANGRVLFRSAEKSLNSSLRPRLGEDIIAKREMGSGAIINPVPFGPSYQLAKTATNLSVKFRDAIQPPDRHKHRSVCRKRTLGLQWRARKPDEYCWQIRKEPSPSVDRVISALPPKQTFAAQNQTCIE
jgi:hypothetical protein